MSRIITILCSLMLLLVEVSVAYADNCGDLQDCYATMGPALVALVAIATFAALFFLLPEILAATEAAAVAAEAAEAVAVTAEAIEGTVAVTEATVAAVEATEATEAAAATAEAAELEVAAEATAEEQKALEKLTEFNGKTEAEIEAKLQELGYDGPVTANSGGKVYTKDLGNGRTIGVRLDPPQVRVEPKGWADELPHAHKESVPTTAVQDGNYSYRTPNKLTFDDRGKISNSAADIHIPIK